MTILTVRHITTYQYKQPVSFGEHRMMLRPRESQLNAPRVVRGDKRASMQGCKHKPASGSEGRGSTRIDLFFANQKEEQPVS
jgi:Bacterial transglutaminase-like N-terminal region